LLLQAEKRRCSLLAWFLNIFPLLLLAGFAGLFMLQELCESSGYANKQLTERVLKNE
jgi:hypothetical protein